MGQSLKDILGCLLVSLLAATSHAAIGQADETGDKVRGKQLAVEQCRRCHVIPGEGNMSVGNSPSFKAMVTSKADDWRHKFEVFYALRPHASFVKVQEFRSSPEFPLGVAPVTISLEDIRHLLAYVDELGRDLRKP